MIMKRNTEMGSPKRVEWTILTSISQRGNMSCMVEMLGRDVTSVHEDKHKISKNCKSFTEAKYLMRRIPNCKGAERGVETGIVNGMGIVMSTPYTENSELLMDKGMEEDPKGDITVKIGLVALVL